MPLNNPNAPSVIIRPRIRVLCGGQEVPGILALTINSKGHYHGDSFAFSMVPPASGIGSLTWWSNLPPITPSNPFDMQIGLLPLGAAEGSGIAWQSMVKGIIDDIDFAPDQNSLSANGRDFTSLLINDRTQNAFQNQTTSEVVHTLAEKFGLACNAVQTTTPVGRFWGQDHNLTSTNQLHSVTTSWDILTTLAQYEGLDVFMDGITLNLQQPAEPSSDPYVWTWKQDKNGNQFGNAPGIRLRRSLALNRGVNVFVRSWNGKQKRSFTRGTNSSTIKTVATNSGVQQYFFSRPNLSEEQAQQLANQLYADISSHEMNIAASTIGDLILTPRCIIQLQGTGTEWDQVYYPTSITRRVSMSGGFSMMVEARNKSPALDGAMQNASVA